MLYYPFMRRAFCAGVILAALLAVLGVFVVLRKMAFFADGIAHASLSGAAAGLLFSMDPMFTALISAIIFAAVIYFLERRLGVSSDSSIGIIFAFGMALGVFLISRRPGYQPELISFLFGNILAIRNSDLLLIAVLGVVILVFIFRNLRALTLMSLDNELAHSGGVRVEPLRLAMNIFLACAVVLGIRILGVVLVSALLIIPVSSAKLVAGGFKQLILISVIFSEAALLSGLTVSYAMDIPAGPAIVLAGSVFFALSGLFSAGSGSVKRAAGGN